MKWYIRFNFVAYSGLHLANNWNFLRSRLHFLYGVPAMHKLLPIFFRLKVNHLEQSSQRLVPTQLNGHYQILNLGFWSFLGGLHKWLSMLRGEQQQGLEKKRPCNWDSNQHPLSQDVTWRLRNINRGVFEAKCITIVIFKRPNASASAAIWSCWHRILLKRRQHYCCMKSMSI